MNKLTRIALAFGALIGLMVMSVELVGADRSPVERTLEPEIPILTPDEGEPPLQTLSDAQIEDLRKGLPEQIAMNGERAAATGIRFSKSALELLAREASRTEIVADGPIFNGSGDVIGHNFELRFSQPQKLEISRRAYSDELHQRLPDLGDQHLLLDGVNRLLIGLGEDGTIIDIVYVPVADNGERVTIEDITPAGQRLIVAVDKNGSPIVDGSGSITVRAGDDEILITQEQMIEEGH